jgi:hypothetical protein
MGEIKILCECAHDPGCQRVHECILVEDMGWKGKQLLFERLRSGGPYPTNSGCGSIHLSSQTTQAADIGRMASLGQKCLQGSVSTERAGHDALCLLSQ